MRLPTGPLAYQAIGAELWSAKHALRKCSNRLDYGVESGGFTGAARLAAARQVRDESEQRPKDRHEQKGDKRSEIGLFIPERPEIVHSARASEPGRS